MVQPGCHWEFGNLIKKLAAHMHQATQRSTSATDYLLPTAATNLQPAAIPQINTHGKLNANMRITPEITAHNSRRKACRLGRSGSGAAKPRKSGKDWEFCCVEDAGVRLKLASLQ